MSDTSKSTTPEPKKPQWTIEECKGKDYLHSPDGRIGLFGWEYEGLDEHDVEAGRKQIRKMVLAANMHDRLVTALEAVSMFYMPWSPEWQKKWDALTGDRVATTKGLCGFVRAALEEPTP